MTDRLNQRLAALEKAIKQKAKKLQSATVIQLPLWPDPVRGVPNSALRGALFAAVQGKDRQALKGELLTVQQGMEIRFTGWQLDQSDLDVWEQALHLARKHPFGTRCDFTAHAFLKALGRSTGKTQHEWLKDVFRRLTACAVEITHDGKTYFGPLIEGGVRDEATGLYVLKLNLDLVKLYGAGMWTAIEWQQRQALRRKPLALWLHGFYATHADPHPMRIETLRELSGSRTKTLFHFTANLKRAFNDLKAIKAIDSYDITDSLVSVMRVLSPSQQKHLSRAKARKK
jgi:hypothetical protein